MNFKRGHVIMKKKSTKPESACGPKDTLATVGALSRECLVHSLPLLIIGRLHTHIQRIFSKLVIEVDQVLSDF